MTTTDTPKVNHALIRNAIQRAVTNIGTTNGTKRPDVPTNDAVKAAAAYKYAVARTVKRIADSLHMRAVKDAIEAGVLFDHKKHPLGANVTQVLFQDGITLVTVSTKTSHSLLSVPDLRRILIEQHQLTVDQVDAAVKAASKQSAVPHEFDASIVGPD